MKETVNTEKDNANRLEIFENQDYIYIIHSLFTKTKFEINI